MKAVLVTGGTGFIGANLVRRLVGDGHTVWLLVRHGHRTWRVSDLQADVRLAEVDLADTVGVRSLVCRIRPDWIFHLAAYGAYPEQTDLDEMVRTNVVGTLNLVRAALAAGVEAFVNTGSSSEYGLKAAAPDEDAVLEPNSHYAVTKASATLFCRYTALAERCWLPTLRVYSAFGPFEEPTRLIPTLLARGLSTGDLPPLAAPETARDFVYVEDVVDAYLRVASTPRPTFGPIYNVGTGRQTTLRQIVEATSRLLSLGASPRWHAMPDRIWDASTWVADPRRIQTTFAWQPTHTVETGLAAFRDWLLAAPERLPFYTRQHHRAWPT